jgi:hypothetical protein
VPDDTTTVSSKADAAEVVDALWREYKEGDGGRLGSSGANSSAFAHAQRVILKSPLKR